MEFFIKSVTPHTKKCNIVEYTIIDGNTILDGCNVKSYVPNSFKFTPGIIMDVPYFIAKGIFGFNGQKNIKYLEKQLQAIAPAGQKRIWRAQATELFNKLSEKNIEKPLAEDDYVGNFIGQPGEEITVYITKVICVHTSEWVSNRWRHTGYGWKRVTGCTKMWKLFDADGNVIMFKTSGAKMNNLLDEMMAKAGFIIRSKVDRHETFQNIRQTWINKIELNPDIFGLLS